MGERLRDPAATRSLHFASKTPGFSHPRLKNGQHSITFDTPRSRTIKKPKVFLCFSRFYLSQTLCGLLWPVVTCCIGLFVAYCVCRQEICCVSRPEICCVCRQDICCVCRQDICCVCRQDICCVCRQEICGLPRHPNGIVDTGERPLRGRFLCVDNGIGMSWQTTDFLSADTTDVLSADATDVLSAHTTDVLSADTTDFCRFIGV